MAAAPGTGGLGRRLALSLGSAVLWFALTATFSYKAEGFLIPLDRSGALPLETASRYNGALGLLQLLGGFGFPWLRKLLNDALGGGLAASALAALGGAAGSLLVCAIFAAQYPAARYLALLWAAASLFAAGLTALFLPAER